MADDFGCEREVIMSGGSGFSYFLIITHIDGVTQSIQLVYSLL